MESDSIKAKLIELMEGQKIMEAKLLIKSVNDLNDISDIINEQWLPCTTDVKFQNSARVMATVVADEQIGLGPVLLIQVKNTQTNLINQQYLSQPPK